MQRRSNASSARRNSAPGYISPDSNHPAVAAAGGDRGGAEGGAVSDAVRALQFQDIDENDFETLLALDEAGGEGGRCCAGGKGLAEEAVEAVLQTGTAGGARLEESCAICMEEFELGDEVRVCRARAFVFFLVGTDCANRLNNEKASVSVRLKSHHASITGYGLGPQEGAS